jgi:serine/threonine protein kinase
MPTEIPHRYALRKDFRYFHEPIPEELSNTWVVGRRALAQELADRIMLSRGGAFLVSGLRGVGKTTCVRLAIHLIRMGRERFARLGGDVELVDVWINLARPLEPVQLLHHLIRHLCLRLKEMRLMERLDPSLREDLETAFLRTSFEISSRSLVGEERERGVEAGFGNARWLGLEFLGKISTSHKQSRSDEEVLRYLPYDEKAAEFEILSFSRRLLDGLQPGGSRWQRWWQRFRHTQRSTPRVKVVFVLDELDKLETDSGQTGKSPLDPVLQALKSVFTASGFSFVFIGGKEAEERLLEDVSRGDSIYESIFAFDIYLPCLWEEQNNIVLQCFEATDGNVSEERNTVALYLRYKGRGVPRRTWRELNKHVLWGDESPVLTLDLERRRYMEVFAKVEEALEGEEAFRTTRGVVDQVHLDRQRLCFYYTMDWVFSRSQDPFNLAQVTETVGTLNLLGSAHDPTLPNRVAQSVIKLLLGRAFIERADLERTQIGQVGEEDMYRLAPWVLLAFHGSPEKQWVPEEAVSGPPTGSRPEFYKIGRYRVLQKIGEGGFAVVYKVSDQQGRSFAAKVLRADLANSASSSVELFEREVEALRMMDHPGILRFYAAGKEQGRPYLVMDLLTGVSLRQLLDSHKKFVPREACSISLELTRIFAYIHSRGLVRLDIKPSNVFLTNEAQIKVLDFGVATLANGLNSGPLREATIVGTPGYMAPEQSSGQADARADIFALGVVLHEMLTGQKPFGPETGESGKLASSFGLEFAAIQPELDSVVQKALAKDPKDRFQTMEEFGQAIEPMAAKDVQEIVKDLMCLAEEGEASSKEDTRSEIFSVPGQVAPVEPAGSVAEADERTPFLARRAPSSDDVSEGSVTLGGSHEPSVRESISDMRADTTESVNDLIRLVRDPRLSVEESAFARLCRLGSLAGTPQLLFDLAREICLWGGLDARVSKIFLRGDPLKMGRAPGQVDLPVQDPSVSRQHTAFFVSPNGVEVEDLSSHSGTFINGKRCRREKLSDGDSLRLGTREITVHVLPGDRTITM